MREFLSNGTWFLSDKQRETQNRMHVQASMNYAMKATSKSRGYRNKIHGEPYKSMTMMGIRDRPPTMWRDANDFKKRLKVRYLDNNDDDSWPIRDVRQGVWYPRIVGA